MPFAGGTANQEILLLPAGKDTLINLTFHPSTDFGAIWSLDGTRVFFSTSRDDPTGNLSGLADYTLYLVPAAGGATQRIVSLGALGWRAYGISPTTGRLHLVRADVLAAQEGLFTLNTDGTGLTRIAAAAGILPPTRIPTPRALVLSTTATHIAFITNKQLYIAPFSSTPTPRTIPLTCTFACESLAWSRDDQRIAYIGDGGLWVVNVATGQNTRIADSDTQCRPDWSPNGAEIAYAHNERLYVVNTTTGARVDLDRRLGCSIQWSPDGQLLTHNGGPNVRNLTFVRRSDGVTRPVPPSLGLVGTSSVRLAP